MSRGEAGKADRIRIMHMLEAANEALSFVRGRQRGDLNHDRMLLYALVRSIEIIGEAAGHVSSEYKRTVPEVPWTKLSGMRNRLIHGYFDIDPDLVWDTTVLDLPPLVAELNRLFENSA